MRDFETPEDAYEEFRFNYEVSPGESPLLPWIQLTAEEKHIWTEEFENYHGIRHTTDGKGGTSHGDPEITRKHRPRA